MKNKKTLLWAAVLGIVLVLAGAGYQFLTKNAPANEPLPAKGDASSAEETVRLPAFSLLDAEGNPVESADFTGKPTVINFWATWCGYCKEELPDFQDAYETYGDRIRFVMIDAVDGARETVELGKQYVAENGYTFPVYFDTEMEAVLSCGVTGFPSTLFISAEGEVLLGWPGYLDGAQLDEMLKAML